jgi:uncharacterized membrane protein
MDLNKWFTFIALVLVSVFSVALVTVRAMYSGELLFIFLLWNLFLAWLPVAFAWLALRMRKWPLAALSVTLPWLLFFPNAPYMLTDLLHLKARAHVPLWYDLILLLTFAVLGLFLGFVSLRMMQDLINGYFGFAAGWLFALAALGAGGLGIYIGRFLRWNSWDLFTRPLLLMGDIWASLGQPRTAVVSGLLAVLLLFAYVLFSVAPGHGPTLHAAHEGETGP